MISSTNTGIHGATIARECIRDAGRALLHELAQLLHGGGLELHELAAPGCGSLRSVQSAAVHALDEIKADILQESRFGEVRVRDVRMSERPGFDDDEDYVQFVAYVDDPEPGALTWPVLDVIGLRQRVWQLASESDVDLPRIVVDVYPRSEDEQPDNGTT